MLFYVNVLQESRGVNTEGSGEPVLDADRSFSHLLRFYFWHLKRLALGSRSMTPPLRPVLTDAIICSTKTVSRPGNLVATNVTCV